MMEFRDWPNVPFPLEEEGLGRVPASLPRNFEATRESEHLLCLESKAPDL